MLRSGPYQYLTSVAALQCCDDWVQKCAAHSALLYSHESSCRMSCLALPYRKQCQDLYALHAMPCQHPPPTLCFLSSFAKLQGMRKLL